MNKTALNIPPSNTAYAESFGAIFDKQLGSWCVIGEVPTELLGYVEKKERHRDYAAEKYPACPRCGCRTVLREGARSGPFWGCSNYPRCKGTVELEEFSINRPATALDHYTHSVSLPESRRLNEHKEIPFPLQNEIKRIVILAIDLLQGEAAAHRWLNKEKITFAGKKPIDMMVDLDGCTKVERLLLETVASD